MPPTMPTGIAESANAASLTGPVRTPMPRARSSSSRIAISCRPKRERRTPQETATVSIRIASVT